MIPVSLGTNPHAEIPSSPLFVLPEQPLGPIITVKIPRTTRHQKVAAIEAGAYWSAKMGQTLLGAEIESNNQPLERILVPVSQVQFPDPTLARERLRRAHFQPSSFSDLCALTAVMFSGEQEMRIVACLGTGFIWGGKEMFAQTSEQSNGKYHRPSSRLRSFGPL
jgi:hypothetical protein